MEAPCHILDKSVAPMDLARPSVEDTYARHHVLLTPVHNRIFHSLSKYLADKGQAPSETSAVILVPRWVGGSPWRKLMQGMRLLHEFPAQTPLFFKTDGNQPPRPVPPIPYPIQAWYDPPAQSDPSIQPGVLT